MATVTECYDCGGNCDPECGRHPEGCFYGAVICNEWGHMITEIVDGDYRIRLSPGPAPRCRLEHPDIATVKAREFLKSMDTGVKVMRRSHYQ